MTSLTVCLDSIFITAAIEVHKEQDMTVIDLPGAFLNASMEDEEEVVMVMKDCLAELMTIV